MEEGAEIPLFLALIGAQGEGMYVCVCMRLCVKVIFFN